LIFGDEMLLTSLPQTPVRVESYDIVMPWSFCVSIFDFSIIIGRAIIFQNATYSELVHCILRYRLKRLTNHSNIATNMV